jgi:hypothetical protein
MAVKADGDRNIELSQNAASSDVEHIAVLRQPEMSKAGNKPPNGGLQAWLTGN